MFVWSLETLALDVLFEDSDVSHSEDCPMGPCYGPF